MKLAAAFLCFVGLTLAPLLMLAPASAAEPLWANVGDWSVLVDRSLGNGCFMLSSYTRGTYLRIGINNTAKNGYVMIGNEAWQSIEVGKEYKLSLEFDGETPWAGTFRATSMGDVTVLFNSFDKPEFLREVAAKQKLTIYYDDKVVTTLPLTGSYAAVQSLIECQSKVDEAASSAPSDPFSSGRTRPASRTGNDPFK
jgi:hypothetical protein